MNIVKKGNDAIFSVLVFSNAGVIVGTNTDPMTQGRKAVDLTQVQNLSVKVEHLNPTREASVPFRTDEVSRNLLYVELPEAVQELGVYNVIIDFDQPNEVFTDKLQHFRIKLELCKVVETDAVTAEYKTPLECFVVQALKGAKGDEGKIPNFKLKKDPSNGKTYMAIGDDYLRDNDGNRVFLQREVANTIDYLPTIDLKPQTGNSWGDGYFYGYMESDVKRFRGKFVAIESASQTGNWARCGCALTPPYQGYTRDGFYNYGFLVYFDYPSKQPVYGDAVKGLKLFAYVVRIKTQGQGTITLKDNNRTVFAQTEDDIFYDVAFPFDPYGERVRLIVITPNAKEVGQPTYLISDVRFVEIDPKDPRTQELFNNTLNK